MVKEIVRDTFFLAQKSEPADRDDVQVIQDLLDTIKANADRCVGMAANMIGVRKTILVALIGKHYLIMVNPKIVSQSSQIYETEEGCLSLNGQRKVKRYKSITVEFLDRNFKKKKQTFKDFEAQIIQHESLFSIFFRTSFRQILPLTASKILTIRQYVCVFFPCNRQNYA